MKDGTTSPNVAKDASKILRDPNSTAEEKRVAASALSQVENQKTEGEGQSSDAGKTQEVSAAPEQPKVLLLFAPAQKSPTLGIHQGEYHRVFDVKDQPFEVSSEDAAWLLREGHFIEAPPVAPVE